MNVEEMFSEEHRVVDSVRALIGAGKVNAADLKHASDLVSPEYPYPLTEGNLRWLATLAKRGGAPFEKP